MDVPPRFFGIKSESELFDTRIGIASGYVFLFFLIIPGAWVDWYIVEFIIEIYDVTIGAC